MKRIESLTLGLYTKNQITRNTEMYSEPGKFLRCGFLNRDIIGN